MDARQLSSGATSPGPLRLLSSPAELDKSAVLDDAYEEYCRRREQGELPDPDQFVEKYPTFQTSLRRLIEAHRFLEENSDLLGESRTLDWPQPGEQFLGFSLIRELGRGAFARVFLATEPALGNRQVAVKISFEGQAEAQTLGRLHHPHVVPIHSIQEEPLSGLTVVCMPYKGRATLCDVLDRLLAQPTRPTRARLILEAVQDPTLPPETDDQGPPDRELERGTYIDGVLHLGVQLAEALAFIHAQGICHRDLKPSNVLMSPAGRPMLLDFNLSFDRQAADTRLGGTLPYMAPEHLLATDLDREANSSLIEERSDLFSLGVILYELLTGTHPFGPIPLKLSPQELRPQLLERQRKGPCPLRKGKPCADRPLAWIIEGCLSYNPNDRPASATNLAQALRQRLSWRGRLRRWAMVHPYRAFGTVLVALAVGSGGGLGAAAYVHNSSVARQLQLIGQAYDQHQYHQALEGANRLLKEEPNNLEALVWRGRILLELGNLPGAQADLEKADSLVPDGRIKAALGYCLNQREGFGYQKAIDLYNQALELGYAPAEVFNNLGYCYWKNHDLDDAQKALDQAITLNDQLQPAFYTRALVDYFRAVKDPTHQYVPLAGMKDIQKAIQLGPPSANLYYHAACLFTVNMKAANPPQILAALNYLRMAVKQGYDPRFLANAGALNDVLQNEREFQALLNSPVPANPPAPPVQVVDPIR